MWLPPKSLFRNQKCAIFDGHICAISHGRQHLLRHTAATHLLRSGVDLNTIRAWLGHVRIETTTVYAEIDLQRKAKAIMLFDSDEPAPDQSYRDDEGLMAFLRSL